MRTYRQQAGINWDSDNRAEITELVDCLIEAAKEELQEAR